MIYFFRPKNTSQKYLGNYLMMKIMITTQFDKYKVVHSFQFYSFNVTKV